MDSVMRPRMSRWDFAVRERQLFTAAQQQIPTWRTANVARKLLAGVVSEASNSVPVPDVELIEDLPASQARQIAVSQLGAIVVRGTGAIITLIGCGYEREALMPARVCLEAEFRARQIGEDSSGDAARQLLLGRHPGSLKRLAQRYGEKGDVEFLDRFSHADLLSLLPLSTERLTGWPSGEVELELRPQRGKLRPAQQLLSAAHTATKTGVIIVEVFGVGLLIPPWLSAQLEHYKENPLPEVL